MNSKPLVSVLCATYNQKDYIAQCIEGFLCQKINFPIEIIIHDDASTDGTAEIVKQYAEKFPDLIKPILQTENQYQKKIGVWKTHLYPSATGKYIAECEGDDYWSDPNKLQKQIDYLEAHPKTVACVHRCKRFNCKINTFDKSFPAEESERDYEFPEAILGGGGLFGSNTFVYRHNAVKNYYNELWKKSPVGDFALLLCLADQGTIHYLPDELSVYRFFAKGSWSSQTLQGPQAYERRFTHVNKMKLFLNEVDKYKNYKYRKAIQEKIDLNDFNLYWDFGKWSLLKTTQHYKQRSLIGKLKAFYHCLKIKRATHHT